MELTTQEKEVLKGLLGKELNHVDKDGEALPISNSPFLGKLQEEYPDLEFMKSIENYKDFLEKLLKKLD